MEKKYFNKERNEWFFSGEPFILNILKVISENGEISYIRNPSEELLLSQGYEEYVPTQEELLEEAKIKKLSLINIYNDSEDVNSFTVNGHRMWLTVLERQQLLTQINAYEAFGRESMTKWHEGIEFTFSISQWKSMFAALEVYCGDALNVTEQHRVNVKALNTIEEVEQYNYKANYPEKLNF